MYPKDPDFYHPNQQIFNRTSKNPDYRLPQTHFSGNCFATVELSTFFGEYEESSWAEIFVALVFLWSECVINERRLDVAGGEAVVGKLGGIKVSMVNTRAPPSQPPPQPVCGVTNVASY